MTYEQFIQNILQTRGRFGCDKEYYERHHIIPKCLGGTDDVDNLIDLFAKEHYIAHQLLAKENPDNDKLTYAWWAMSHWVNEQSQERYKVTAEEYEEVKLAYSQFMSKRMSGENCPFYGVSRFGKDNPHYGHKHSPETKRRISELAKGRKHTQEAKDKISASLKALHRIPWNTGQHLSEEHKRKVSIGEKNSELKFRRKVKQYDLEGNFIKEWKSIQDANDFYGYSQGGSHISDCCYYKRDMAYGYMWRFSDDKTEVRPYSRKNCKKVVQIDIQTSEILHIYNSLAEAAKSVDGASSNITVCCSHKYPNNKIYKGYIWKYLDDIENKTNISDISTL